MYILRSLIVSSDPFLLHVNMSYYTDTPIFPSLSCDKVGSIYYFKNCIIFDHNISIDQKLYIESQNIFINDIGT